MLPGTSRTVLLGILLAAAVGCPSWAADRSASWPDGARAYAQADAANTPLARAAKQRESERRISDQLRAAEEAAKRAENAASQAARDLEAARRILEEVRRHAEAAKRPGETPPPPADAAPRTGGGRVLRVGPGRRLTRPSDAARIARSGDTVEIDSAIYSGDVAVWRADNLLLRGVGGRPRLRAGGRTAEGKAIWVIKGRNTTVENVEFSGARVRDRNGAGIRQEGSGLTVRHSWFHGNQIGLLTGHTRDSDVLIEHSEFSGNVVRDSIKIEPGHNIYIGRVRSFTLRFSYIHGAVTGHNVKSRARRNDIRYNRIMDERNGKSSYLIDISEGGTGFVIGNLLHQSQHTGNSTLISFGAERQHPSSRIYVVNNTMVNDRHHAVFVNLHGDARGRIINNIIAGRGNIARGTADIAGNLSAREISGKSGGIGARIRRSLKKLSGDGANKGNYVSDNPGFAEPGRFDYRLVKGSPALNSGIEPGSAGDVSLMPEFEYVHPRGKRVRPRIGKLDIGALEGAER